MRERRGPLGRGANPSSALPRWLARIRSAVACTMPAVYHSPDHDLGGPRPAGFEEDKLPPLMKHIEQWTSGVTSARCRALFACAPFARENCPPALTEGARQTKVCGPGVHLARRRPGARYYSLEREPAMCFVVVGTPFAACPRRRPGRDLRRPGPAFAGPVPHVTCCPAVPRRPRAERTRKPVLTAPRRPTRPIADCGRRGDRPPCSVGSVRLSRPPAVLEEGHIITPSACCKRHPSNATSRATRAERRGYGPREAR